MLLLFLLDSVEEILINQAFVDQWMSIIFCERKIIYPGEEIILQS